MNTRSTNHQCSFHQQYSMFYRMFTGKLVQQDNQQILETTPKFLVADVQTCKLTIALHFWMLTFTHHQYIQLSCKLLETLRTFESQSPTQSAWTFCWTHRCRSQSGWFGTFFQQLKFIFRNCMRAYYSQTTSDVPPMSLELQSPMKLCNKTTLAQCLTA